MDLEEPGCELEVDNFLEELRLLCFLQKPDLVFPNFCNTVVMGALLVADVSMFRTETRLVGWSKARRANRMIAYSCICFPKRNEFHPVSQERKKVPGLFFLLWQRETPAINGRSFTLIEDS